MAFHAGVTVVLLLVGVALLVRGYRLDRRQLLLTGALMMFAAVVVPEFAEGFAKGVVNGYQHSDAHRL